MEKYICFSEDKGDGQRALYYSPNLGVRRIYRSSYPIPDNKGQKLRTFSKRQDAEDLCTRINKAYNDDFKAIILPTLK